MGDPRLWLRVGLGLVGVIFVVLVVSAALGVIFSQRGDDRSDDPQVVVETFDATIDIEGFNFQPGNVSVPAGATVTWVNHDGARTMRLRTATTGRRKRSTRGIRR